MNWIYNILKPVDPSEAGDYLVRCNCNRIMWLKAPNKIKKHHTGHVMRPLEHGTFFEFLQLKLGLINRRTFGEWLRDKMESRAE
jgi:hypothetical protein